MAKLNNGEGLAMNLGGIIIVIIATVGIITSFIHFEGNNI
jgi:hypothetical protein